jgi:hypothetical protein
MILVMRGSPDRRMNGILMADAIKSEWIAAEQEQRNPRSFSCEEQLPFGRPIAEPRLGSRVYLSGFCYPWVTIFKTAPLVTHG